MWQTKVENASTLASKDAIDAGKSEDSFEENFKELKKWVDVKTSKFGTLAVLREKRRGRLGAALKVFPLAIFQFLFFILVTSHLYYAAFRFGLPLKVFKMCTLERDFHTLIKNALSSSSTDVGSHLISA